MDRDIALLLIGAGIALVSSVVIAILAHFLSLRAGKVRRERDREESIREQTRATLMDSSGEAVNGIFETQAIKQERLLRVLEETQRFDQEGARFIEEGARFLEGGARFIEEGDRASVEEITRFIGEGARFIEEGTRFIEEGDRASVEEIARIIEEGARFIGEGARFIEEGTRFIEEGASDESPEVKD
jgi:hypothetical protein